MASIDEKINNALGITHDLAQELVSPKPIVRRPDEDSDHADVDYKYSRENFYNLVERGQDAIDGILELARESEHPRTYEVAGQLIKTVAEVAEKLTDLQDKAPPRVAKVTQQAIGTPDEDDNFGFNETISEWT